MRRSGKGQLYEDRKKQAIKLQRRYNVLWKAKRSLPLVPLKNPYRQGFDRVFVVRQDLIKSPEGKILNKILSYINTTAHCKDTKFLEKDYKTGKMRPVEQELKYLTEEDFNKLDKNEQSYFKRVILRRKSWWSGETKFPAFVFSWPWMFEFKVRPYFVTHIQVLNGDIESELSQINQKLWIQGFAREWGDHTGNFDEDYFKRGNASLNKELNKELNEY